MKVNRCVCCGEVIPEGRMVCKSCEEFETNECPCYEAQPFIVSVMDKVVGPEAICIGTKECDICTCGGDVSRCDHYPEKREKGQKVKNALAIEQLKEEAKKLGYRLAKIPEKVRMLPCPVCGKKDTTCWSDYKCGYVLFFRRCNGCGFEGKCAGSESGLNKTWNKAVEEYLKREKKDDQD